MCQKLTYEPVNLPIGGLSFLVIVLFFRTPAHAAPAKATLKEKMLQMDILGTLLILASVISLLLAMQWGGATQPWFSSHVIGTLVGFGLIGLAFIAWEIWLGERAAVSPRLLRSKTFTIQMAYQSFIGGTFFTLLYVLCVPIADLSRGIWADPS